MSKIKIELNEKQAVIIADALEIYARLIAGDLKSALLPPVMMFGKKIDNEKFESTLYQLKKVMFPKLDYYENNGISMEADTKELTDTKIISYEMYKMIRYYFESKSNNESYSVYKEKPMQLSNEPFIEIKEG
jgi:hypothetical protein